MKTYFIYDKKYLGFTPPKPFFFEKSLVLQNNKTIFNRLHKIHSSRRNYILTIEIR